MFKDNDESFSIGGNQFAPNLLQLQFITNQKMIVLKIRVHIFGSVKAFSHRCACAVVCASHREEWVLEQFSHCMGRVLIHSPVVLN